MNDRAYRDVVFIASALRDLRVFPDDVRSVIGFALYLAQQGGLHVSAKPLKGFKGSGVVEVADDFDGDTYRAVYTVRYDEAVYVLHAFQKKSRNGIATPQRDVELIRSRLAIADQLHRDRMQQRRDS